MDGGFEDYEAEARRLTALPRVEAAAPAILGRALARTRARDVFISVKGIDPKLEPTVTRARGGGHPRKPCRFGDA